MLTTTPTIDTEFARIVDELTRRGFLAGGIGVAALAGLAACGSTDPEATTAATRTIDTTRGKVTVPVDPKRVVTLGTLPLYPVLDLGLSPIGSDLDANSTFLPARYAKTMSKVARAGSQNGNPNYEAIAEMKPDLILGLDADGNIYPRLSGIAPTVYVPFGSGVSWQDRAQFVADALNRPSGLREIKKQYEQQVQSLKTAHGQTLARYRWDVIKDWLNGTFVVYGKGDNQFADILVQLGIPFASASAGFDPDADNQYSYERIAGKLGDAQVIVYWIDRAGTPVGTGRLFDSQPWRDLSAVKAGRTFGITNMVPSSYGPAMDALAEIETILTKLKTSR